MRCVARNVCNVNSNGVLNWNDCDYRNGVRPFWWISEGYKPHTRLQGVLHCIKRAYNLSHYFCGINKNFMTDFEKLIDFGNLYRSYKLSMKGSGKRKSAASFDSIALQNLYAIKQDLINHAYTISPYQSFVVSEPKRREVMSGSFRDKVLQHCLCDYVLLPELEHRFIIDNYAGQKGKGTLFGLDRLSKHLADHYAEYGCQGYILKCDISKFFYSIDHDKMKRCIRDYFSDEDIGWVCDLLIDSTQGVGLALGNQSSQVFALMYLDGLDHYVTEELGCVRYGRYMDDFFLISPSREYLKECLSRIGDYLGGLSLSLNNKTEIVPIRKGIRFLGFHVYLTNDGKIIRKLTGDNKRMIKKRLRTYSKLVKTGKMTEAEFYESYYSWRNHALHGNCYHLVLSMDDFVRDLLSQAQMT